MDIVPEPVASAEVHDDTHNNLLTTPKAALTPPTSEDLDKRYGSSSELSDLEDDDDEEIEPDHYYDGGKIPVFKPTMDQFRSFRKFIDKIDKYGMKSGIVKVIPPKEWRESLPNLKEAVKTIKVKNPITQEFAGQHGIYTQANIEKQRSYNLPQWKALTEEHNHQPPAKRGERRRRGQEPATRIRSTRNGAASTATQPANDGPKRKPGRPRKRPLKKEEEENSAGEEDEGGDQLKVPPTPTSPDTAQVASNKAVSKVRESIEQDDTPSKPRGRQPAGRQPKSISSRRKNNRQDVADEIDEEAFKNFNYRLEHVDEYTLERCRELEEIYWKTINFGSPMYGADMPGSLFDDSTTSWNVAHLENLLDVLGTKVPGVNTAYLYLGMWKATFAWHLEDVDLYSINYIHFGAPKQWYSISQEDARRFEAAMKSIWPRDAKNCSQFLRHKTYLISPIQLEKQFNIKVNKLVHYEGEFVITYPYGYHSGYNLGYNCAESVNFANEAWLDYGRIAKKCECESDSVWVDVAEIERKLRGEPTPEYYEETDEEEEDEDDVQNELPSPPASVAGKSKATANRKRKRDAAGKDASARKVKRIKIRIRMPNKEPPCVLCPNDVAFDDLLPTDNGLKAHRLCALYTPETYISDCKPEKVCNVANIDKARLDLKCLYCRSKRGAVFQCSAKKCTRAFHATCAPAAGVLVDDGPMQTFGEDGTEYVYEGYDFRCRFHRPKRPKNADVDSLEESKLVKEYAQTRKPKDVVQFQYLGGEIYAGTVIENRPSEMSIVIDVLPDGDRTEIEWKYLLVLDPADSQRPKPSADAKPLPTHMNSSNSSLDARNRKDGIPEMGDPFQDPNSEHKWAELNLCPEAKHPNQAKVDFSKSDQLWYYLGKTSTEARAQYTEDLAKQRYNVKSNFLDTVKPPPPPPVQAPRRSFSAAYPVTPVPSGQRPYMQQPYNKQQYQPKAQSAHSVDARYQSAQYPRPYPPYPPQHQQPSHGKPGSHQSGAYGPMYPPRTYSPETPRAQYAPTYAQPSNAPHYGRPYAPHQSHYQTPQPPVSPYSQYQPYNHPNAQAAPQQRSQLQQRAAPVANMSGSPPMPSAAGSPPQATQTAQSSRNVGAGPATATHGYSQSQGHGHGHGLGLSNTMTHPNSVAPQLPGWQFQTPQQFQMDVSSAPSHPQVGSLSRFENMIQQLNGGRATGTARSPPASTAAPAHGYTTLKVTAAPPPPAYGSPTNTHAAAQSPSCLPPAQATPTTQTSAPATVQTPQTSGANPAEPPKHPPTPNSLNEQSVSGSPKRPDYSPLSDDGWPQKPQIEQAVAPPVPPLQQPAGGAETWRYG